MSRARGLSSLVYKASILMKRLTLMLDGAKHLLFLIEDK